MAITWANVDLVPCHHMASPGHNELNVKDVPNEKVCVTKQNNIDEIIYKPQPNSPLKKMLLPCGNLTAEFVLM